MKWLARMCEFHTAQLIAFGLIVAGALVFLVGKAPAQISDARTGVGVMCTTAEGAKLFGMQAAGNNGLEALRMAKEKHGDVVDCEPVQALYYRGAIVDEFDSPSGRYAILRLAVIGIGESDGYMRLLPAPLVRYVLTDPPGQPL